MEDLEKVFYPITSYTFHAEYLGGKKVDLKPNG